MLTKKVENVAKFQLDFFNSTEKVYYHANVYKGEKIMKKRKNAVLAFLLCAAIGLGVGYAAVTKDLTINGTIGATPNDDAFTVVFTGDVVETDTINKLEASATEDGVVGSFQASGLNTIGETVSAKYTVENQSTDYKASLSAKIYTDEACNTEWTSNEYVTLTVSCSSENLAAEGTGTVTVTAKLEKLPITDVNLSFWVKITGEAVEA